MILVFLDTGFPFGLSQNLRNVPEHVVPDTCTVRFVHIFHDFSLKSGLAVIGVAGVRNGKETCRETTITKDTPE